MFYFLLPGAGRAGAAALLAIPAPERSEVGRTGRSARRGGLEGLGALLLVCAAGRRQEARAHPSESEGRERALFTPSFL